VDGLGDSRWIWCSGTDPGGYNQTVYFRKEFTVRRRQEARLRIVADSWYRVRLNGVWIHDGPARAYPEEMVYDEHDCTAALRRGKNRIEVIVRYFGCGTFHQIPREGGLRAALQLEDGTVIGTDASIWMEIFGVQRRQAGNGAACHDQGRAQSSDGPRMDGAFHQHRP
jgi:hypothetical protein